MTKRYGTHLNLCSKGRGMNDSHFLSCHENLQLYLDYIDDALANLQDKRIHADAGGKVFKCA